jgi:2-polyprenyl-3-methyl-5-hydroxy-6-metoxy-1,4-benzoquinol methylase
MRLGLHPESALERLALALGQVPTPFAETHSAPLLARAVMSAVRFELFEALTAEPATAEEVAARVGTHAGATRALFGALAGAGYLKARGESFSLTPSTRKWLLVSSPRSLVDSVRFRELEWRWMGRLDDFVATGRAIDFHAGLDAEGWRLYQRGMRAFARVVAGEVARRTPVPRRATTLLDLAGGHGAFAAALCRRHPGLSATVLDLPPALEGAAPLLAEEGLGERLRTWPADALTADLGTDRWDVILVSQLLHHLSEPACRDLVARSAQALKPGGVLVVQEVDRPRHPGAGGGLAALGHLYFALTSHAGAWCFEEIARWQREAGLEPLRPVKFRMLPGVGQQSGRT